MERRPCVNFDTCPLRSTKRGCFEDVHHKYWTKKMYSSPIAQEFRELEENKVLICRDEHNFIHETQLPPRKPSEEHMRAAVELAKIAINTEVA